MEFLIEIGGKLRIVNLFACDGKVYFDNGTGHSASYIELLLTGYEPAAKIEAVFKEFCNTWQYKYIGRVDRELG